MNNPTRAAAWTVPFYAIKQLGIENCRIERLGVISFSRLPKAQSVERVVRLANNYLFCPPRRLNYFALCIIVRQGKYHEKYKEKHLFQTICQWTVVYIFQVFPLYNFGIFNQLGVSFLRFAQNIIEHIYLPFISHCSLVHE